MTDKNGHWGKEELTLLWRSPILDSESTDRPDIPFKGTTWYVSADYDPIPCFLRVKKDENRKVDAGKRAQECIDKFIESL